MRTKRKVAIVLAMMLFACILVGCGNSNTLGSATSQMLNPIYWNGTEDVIMTPEQIDKYNKKVMKVKDSQVVDLLKADTTIRGYKVKEMIEHYSIDEECPYLGIEKIRKKDVAGLEAATNKDKIEPIVKVRYGIVTEPVNVRAYPTELALTEDAVTTGPQACDYFQLTHFRLGQGVLIYNTSLKGDYYFVQGSNYYGWVEAEHIALCSRTEFEDYMTCDDFLVTTELKDVLVDGQQMTLSMGTKLNMNIDKVSLPTRGKDGVLVLKDVDRPNIESRRGYMAYNTKNLYKLALSQVGDRYDWGGQSGHYDCSDFIMSVYSVFGINLPRDEIAKIDFGCVDLTNPSNESRLIPGSILVMDGHYMMYLGTVDGEIYGVHVIAETYNGHKQLLKPYKTVVSSTSDLWRYGGTVTMRSTIYKGINVKLK